MVSSGGAFALGPFDLQPPAGQFNGKSNKSGPCCCSCFWLSGASGVFPFVSSAWPVKLLLQWPAARLQPAESKQAAFGAVQLDAGGTHTTPNRKPTETSAAAAATT